MDMTTHKIQNKEVNETSIGSKVTYIPSHANGNASHPDAEGGTISSWNDRGIFVNYGKNTCMTDPDDLVWG